MILLNVCAGVLIVKKWILKIEKPEPKNRYNHEEKRSKKTIH